MAVGGGRILDLSVMRRRLDLPSPSPNTMVPFLDTNAPQIRR